MTPGEVRRLYFIIRTFLSYGLDELIPKMRITDMGMFDAENFVFCE